MFSLNPIPNLSQVPSLLLAVSENMIINTSQFSLSDDIAQQFTVTTTKPNFVRMTLVLISTDPALSLNVGDEIEIDAANQDTNIQGPSASTHMSCPFSGQWSQDDGTYYAMTSGPGGQTSTGDTILMNTTDAGPPGFGQPISFSNFALKVYWF